MSIAAPGDLLHIDIKKFARIVKAGHRLAGDPRDETRGAGWEFLYVAVDDHSRIAFTAMYPDEKAVSASGLLVKAVACFGIVVRRVLTENGPCFLSHLFRDLASRLHIVRKRTRHYRPQTNGKAERFIQTAIREGAYARRYENSAQRCDELLPCLPWTHQYNWHRPHTSLENKPPIARSGLHVNNLLIHHS